MFSMHNDIGFMGAFLLLGADVEGGGAPRMLPPFLCSGSVAAAVCTTKTKRKKQGNHPLRLVADNAKRGLRKAGGRMQRDTIHAGRGAGRNVARGCSPQEFRAS